MTRVGGTLYEMRQSSAPPSTFSFDFLDVRDHSGGVTAGLLSPISADARIRDEKRSELDRLYHRVIDDLDALVQAVGLKAA